ncbi:MAG: RDD family protein [Bacteroidetes bacterium]|nr:RDD family protein [Bacteroidota bacterium]
MDDSLLDFKDNENIGKVEYAGFWIRFFACLIDGLILFVVNLILGISFDNIMFIQISIDGFFTVLYFTYFESSLKQATIGKQLLNIKVVDKNGFRLTPFNALIRNMSKIISAFILFIGYLMAAFDAQKQSLHDKFAGAFVIKL